jgi:hypothetical protein
MTTQVEHSFLFITILASPMMAGCSSDPCEQQPNSVFCAPAADETGGGASDTGDTEGGLDDDCVPNLPDNEIGQQYVCQGTGNGWLVLDVFGDGVQPPECVNWGGDKPDEPTTADFVPLDLTMLPNDVPSREPAAHRKPMRYPSWINAAKIAASPHVNWLSPRSARPRSRFPTLARRA